MKKKWSILPALAVALTMVLSGCADSFNVQKEGVPEVDIRADIQDVSDENSQREYKFTAASTDTYTFTAEEAAKVQIFDSNGKQLASEAGGVSLSLTEGEEYFMKVTTNQADEAFTVNVKAAGDEGLENPYMPFENIFTETDVKVEASDTDPLEPCKVEYKKREGGTWIYSNNPEMLAQEDVGAALLRTEDMSGMYNFTFEHSNHSDGNIFLGYQLLNTGTEDALVTVYNIGFQVDGEWLGQRSWSDFYNVRYELPDDYFDENGEESWIYRGQDFLDYTPRVFKPTTYRIPAGEYIYVMGGTSNDAANKVNVADTADKQILKGRCANGAVQFKVTGGQITGTLYAYTSPSQVQANPKEQGQIDYRNDRNYAAQYKGTDPHLGLIEANLKWTVNDQTPAGRLPVTYDTMYDDNADKVTEPYAEYNSTSHTVNDDEWLTALNPQNNHTAVGTDMMVFNCVDTEGNPLIIDNEHTDGRGEPANTGNWMVTYNDNITLVNSGTRARTFKVYKAGATGGCLMSCIRDKDGKVYNPMMNIHPILYTGELPATADPSKYVLHNNIYWPIIDGVPFYDMLDDRALVYTVTVEPMSYVQFTVDYLILANSNGGTVHWITVD